MFSFKFSKISAAALLFIGGAAGADEPKSTLLDDVVRRREVAGQAFELDMDTMLAEAERADPAKAEEILQKAFERIEKETNLSPRRRASLTKLVENRLRRTRSAGLTQQANPAPAKAPAIRNKAIDDQAVRDGLAAIRVLRQQGNMKEAQRVAEDLARKYPTHPVAQQVRRSSSSMSGLHETGRIYEEKADRTAAALRDVDQSATSIKGDVEYSPKFAAMSAQRKEKYAPGRVILTKKEKEIIRALDSRTTEVIEFKDMSFDRVIELLQKELGQPLIVNRTAVEEQKIDYDLPISASVPEGVSKRTMLLKILSDLGLTYVVKGEAIHVTSVLRAQNEMVVRHYQIDDFLPLAALPPAYTFNQPGLSPYGQWFPGQGAPVVSGPAPAVTAPKQGMTVEDLIEMIQRSIAPSSWQKNGGQGTITYFAPTRSLIIRNSAEVINQFGAAAGK